VCVRAYVCVGASSYACAPAGVALPSMQSACSVLYCHLRPLWLHQIFRHCLINRTIFGEKVTENKMCLIFFTNFIRNILILRIIQRDNVIRVKTCLCNVSEFSRQIFGKKLKYQISSKFVQWELSCFMRVGGHNDANSSFSQFCERA
jgi:hypothetical protein